MFHESDLLVAECLLGGVFDGLDAATLAGLLSVFVYEHRSPEPPPPPWFPSTDARERWRRIVADQRGPRRRRAVGRPRRAPPARSRLRRRRPRLGGRGGPGRGRRRRGADRRRLRAHDEAARRPRPPGRPRRAGRARRASGRGTRRPRRSAASSPTAWSPPTHDDPAAARTGATPADLPPDVVDVTTDADAGRAARCGTRPVRLCGGDLWTSLGARTRPAAVMRVPGRPVAGRGRRPARSSRRPRRGQTVVVAGAGRWP